MNYGITITSLRRTFHDRSSSREIKLYSGNFNSAENGSLQQPKALQKHLSRARASLPIILYFCRILGEQLILHSKRYLTENYATRTITSLVITTRVMFVAVVS